MLSRTEGDVSNRMEIANDPNESGSGAHELTRLYAVQSSDYWFFGFDAISSTVPITYSLYIDKDHKEGSGGHLIRGDIRLPPSQPTDPNT